MFTNEKDEDEKEQKSWIIKTLFFIIFIVKIPIYIALFPFIFPPIFMIFYFILPKFSVKPLALAMGI